MKTNIFLSLRLLTLLNACAPNLDNNLRPIAVANKVEEEGTKGRLSDFNIGYANVNLGQINDRRQSEALALIDSREVSPSNDLIENFTEALKKRMQEAGMVERSGAPMLNVNITEWLANVTPSFPNTTVNAKAAFEVELRKGLNVIYRGSYSGESERKSPFLTKHEVEKQLGIAMSVAISQFEGDRVLRGSLSK